MINLANFKKIIPLTVASLFIAACSSSETPSKVFVYKESSPKVKDLVTNIKRFECHTNQNQATPSLNSLNCQYDTMDGKSGVLSIASNFNTYTNNFNFIGLHQEQDGKYILEAGDPNKPISASYAKQNEYLLNESVAKIALRINHAVKLATPVYVRHYRVDNDETKSITNGELVVNYYQFQVQQNGNEEHHFKDESSGQSLKLHLSKLFTNSKPEIITIPTSVLKYIKVPHVSYKNNWVESSYTVDSRLVPINSFNGLNIHDFTNLIYLSEVSNEVTSNQTTDQYETLKYGLDLKVDKLKIINSQTLSFEPEISYTNIKLDQKQAKGKKPELTEKKYNHSVKLSADQTTIISLPSNEGVKRIITFSLFAR